MMNLKQSIKRGYATIRQQKSTENKKDFLVTPKKTRTFEETQSYEDDYSSLKRPCTRCFKSQAFMKCSQCVLAQFCHDCDHSIHSIGKFLNHHRNLLPPLNQIGTNRKTWLSFRLNDSEEESKIKDLKSIQINSNISQIWQKIASLVNSRFQEIIDELQDKRKQILFKIQAKKQKQIKVYRQALSQWQAFIQENKNEKSNIKKNYNEKIQRVQAKIKSIENQYSEIKTQKKSQEIISSFEVIQNIVSKFDVRNIFSKPNHELYLPTTKKPMKSSMVISSCTSTATSPNTKTPSYMKSPLSQSTLEPDVKENSLKTSQQGSKIKIAYIQKEVKLLSKVRSEKLFCKSPKNYEKFAKESILTIKKKAKMEQ